MSDDHRKLYSKKGTGTVPKIKHRNNANPIQNDRYSNVVLSNNLGRDTDRLDSNRQYRNSSRNFVQFLSSMDQSQTSTPRQNGTITSNGTSTPNTSQTNSRRNSCGTVPKCDNVTKYPDKKQIEAKLNQIREYLRVTSSLMSNMKNTDEQSNEEEMDRNQLETMIKDLVDSEAKLVVLLSELDGDCEGNIVENNVGKLVDNHHETVLEPPSSTTGPSKKELEQKMEEATREMQMLKEQENLLLHLQLNAESQLREARIAQEKLMKGHNQSRNTNLETDSLLNGFAESIDVVSNSGASSKNFNDNQLEMVRDLEERLKLLNNDVKNQAIAPEHYQNQIDSLQSRIMQIREGNDNRNHLIHMLDNRDAQLQAEHTALQGKLMELQNKKMQVDQLVLQLQNMNEESEDEEMGSQVKMIVNMKEQLAKLKDMLNVVQNTEASLDSQNVNESDIEEHVWRLCSKTDNLIQNDVRTNRNHVDNSRIDNNSGQSSNERRVKEKQVNKKSMNANERERIKLQAELQAKKRELEELMCKHKAATSNLNHDVNSENKSDAGACGNPLSEGTLNSWLPIPSNVYNLPQSSDRYSSDDCAEDDMNEYSEINSSADICHHIQPMPSLTYPTSNYTKRREDDARIEVPSDAFLHAASRTPDRSVRSTSVATGGYQGERNRTNANNEATNKNQIQKKFELIRSVCDSILEQQTSNNQPSLQVRNNLTPSPVYSEPRQYPTSPNAHNMNALNIVHPMESMGPFPTIQPFSPSEPGNYQNWLTTNTLQTQAFMLNTLNQCCQMLWHQQRELSTLRSTVNMMQEQCPQYPYMFPNSPNNQQCPRPKVNPGVIPGAASMPNLNHAAPQHHHHHPHHCSQTNIDHASCAGHCNVQTARILDTALNNTVPAAAAGGSGEHINNSVLHGPSHQTIPTQIWNGQALNNQVAPGNRANNYWDNFRSYSRQNLLSTKSNEGLQNASILSDRTNNSSERLPMVPQPPAPPPPPQKRNTENQESLSADNTPGRLRVKVARQRSNSSAATVPPDVLNINQIQQQKTSNDFSLDFQPTDYQFSSDDSFKEGNRRNRNEWHDDAQSQNNSPKSKLFEELRENVYKEVASLISANQGRPHFLIQLFRDLQLISSDPLRRRTLQSIQSVITSSLNTPGSSTGATRQIPNIQTIESDTMEGDNAASGDFFDVQPFIWPKTLLNQTEAIEPNSPEHLSEVLTFLNAHNEDIFSDSLVHALRDTLVESTFSAIFANSNSKDCLIQKHFASLLTEALEQYRGKKVQDVRINVLQTVEDLLRGEISLIRLMRENITESDGMEPCIPIHQYDLQVPLMVEEPTPQIQNGDLAEADQSRIELEDDDEGAVGGVLNILLERSSSSNAGQVLDDEIEIPKLDLVLNTESDVEYVEQGLDQVPTRLTTYNTSRSNTPSKDKKNGQDQF